MPIDLSGECLDDYAKLYNKFNGFAIVRKGLNDSHRVDYKRYVTSSPKSIRNVPLQNPFSGNILS